ncbi:MAG TPA: hypothetical protein VLL05_05960 [Terriglobales bacterium]|nr:hypothetical protein [Terriglobales bacterium]
MLVALMPVHIRRCVECPKCLTRYLIGFSPYRNGSYLAPSTQGSFEEYTLYCSCRRPAASSQWKWKWTEMKPYAVTKAAHQRGYGTSQDIVALGDERTPQTTACGTTRSGKFRQRKASL